MTIFSTKDFNNGKSDKVKAAVGVALGLPGAANNNQVGDWLTQKCREVVQWKDDIDYAAAKPEPDQL